MQIQKKKPQVMEVKYDEIVYRRLGDIPGYSQEVLNVTFFYIKIKDYYGKDNPGYLRCTKKQAYDYRNVERNTEREEFSFNEHFWNHSESYCREIEDENGDMTVIEYEDKGNLSPDEYSYIEETKEKARSLVKDEMDLKIIECLLNGVPSDGDISKIVGLSRSSVQERRTKLQKLFKEQMADYRDGLLEQERNRTCQFGNKKY